MTKKIILKHIFSVLILISIFSCAETSEVTLKGLDGKDYQLSDYTEKGKWTIVNVWSTSCPYCRNEMPDLQDFHDAHKNSDATVLGIAIDFPSFGYPKPQVIKDYTNDYFIDFPNLLSDAEQASEIIGEKISMIPLTFFYNEKGILIGQWKGSINQQEIEKVMAEGSDALGPFGSGSR
ncbi:MAG: TlpA disulfide reductase family protein [Gammaproteobacteria bacterium]